MANRLIPVWLLVVIGAGLIGLILYASPDAPEINIQITDEPFISPLKDFPEKIIPQETELVIPDEIPYFKTFKEEITWYTQFEPTLMIEEPDCDTLVKKYKGFAEFQDRVNYSFRILEVCDLG